MATGAPNLLFEPGSPDSAPRPLQTVEKEPARELRWHRRPVLRATIKVAAIVAPAVASAVAAIAFSRTVRVPQDVLGTIVWWTVFTTVIVAAWLVTSELLQRMLPLATLLDLTLAFPDSVPSRFAILRRRIDRRQLDADLRRLRARSDPESGPRAQLILELAIALSVHDSRTRGHSERVRMYTDLVAQQLHLRSSDVDRLRWAALLHDIGKLAVAPEILNKPELPDDEELESLRHHPVEGYEMIAPLHKWLGPWAAAVRDHHERFDGTGYPNRLSGRSISLGGRIVAVADSFETMTTGRPYRKALSLRAAREELVRRSGTHFDPYVVRAFLATSMTRLWPVAGLGALVASVPLLASVSWRVSQVGARAASGVVAASATATLVVAGVAGPAALLFVHGPSANSPKVAQVTRQLPPRAQPQPAVITPPASAVPPSPTTPSPAPPASSAGPSGSIPSTSTGTQGSGGGKAIYPAGITRRGALPPGIARQLHPFAQWRLHH